MKIYSMKTMNFEKTFDIFNEFALTMEEMNFVRGGEGDNEIKPPPDPVKI